MKNKSKKLIVVLVVLILLAMAVAYAATSQTLTITGTARVAADVSQVIITGNDQATASEGVVENSAEFTDTTATFDVTLPEPGAEATYTVTIENQGNSTASLTETKYFLGTVDGTEMSLAEINAAEHEGLKFEVSEIPASIDAGATVSVTVRAYWDEAFTNIPTDAEKTMTLQVTYGIQQ